MRVEGVPDEPPVVLVTGATAGIGHAAARRLAGSGWSVLVHGRTQETALQACARIRAEASGARVWPVSADFASLSQVRDLAAEVSTRFARLYGLINNAGLFTPNTLAHRRRISADGFELTWAVNYLAAFALTTALAEHVSVVVSVSSGMQAEASSDVEDLLHEKAWDRVTAYARSKLALTMFACELADRSAGRLNSYAVNPGYVDTRLVRHAFGGPAGSVDVGAGWVVSPIMNGWDGTAEASGGYFDQGERVPAHPLTRAPSARRRLWELSQAQLEKAFRQAPRRAD